MPQPFKDSLDADVLRAEELKNMGFSDADFKAGAAWGFELMAIGALKEERVDSAEVLDCLYSLFVELAKYSCTEINNDPEYADNPEAQTVPTWEETSKELLNVSQEEKKSYCHLFAASFFDEALKEPEMVTALNQLDQKCGPGSKAFVMEVLNYYNTQII